MLQEAAKALKAQPAEITGEDHTSSGRSKISPERE